jgi:hypothetical protein
MNDARRGLLYACVYEKKDSGLVRKCDYLLQPIDEVLKHVDGEVIFVGDGITHARDRIMDEAKARGAKLIPHFETDKHWLPKAKELARLGYQRLLRGDYDKIEMLLPLYLYPEDCQVARRDSSTGHLLAHPSAGAHVKTGEPDKK